MIARPVPTSKLHFHEGRIEEVAELVRTYHYTGRWPHIPLFVGSLHIKGGLLGDSGPAVCGACFAIPGANWKESPLELARLVRREDMPGVPLTLLLRLCLSRLKQRGYHLLVSYADKQQGHHGGIYQAAGWNYHGLRRPAVEGFVIDGTFVPKRTAGSRWGTSSAQRIAALLPGSTVVPRRDQGKHLYWKALDAEGRAHAQRCRLETHPYPKEERG